MTMKSFLGIVAEERSIPTPGFEGFEKRLEVEFSTMNDPTDHEIQNNQRGLRAISRAEINRMLRAAECTIVSELNNEKLDSYVLSESSLFIYPFKIVIKTCGTTQILKTIPHLLASASRLSLYPLHCKYTRGSFLFPHAQPFPHGSFTEEVNILNKSFTHLSGKAFTMGDPSNHLHNWHIYVATAEVPDHPPPENLTYTLEMCMTGLDELIASRFYKAACSGMANEMTIASGISQLLPNSQICDFAFDPCGYSMNGIEDNAHSTIHITPEDGFSYASFETMGYDSSRGIELDKLVDLVAVCFKPAFLSIALYAYGCRRERAADNYMCSWNGSICPAGYICDGTSRQDLPKGSAVIYHTYTKTSADSSCLNVSPLPLFIHPDSASCQLKSLHANHLADDEDDRYDREHVLKSLPADEYSLFCPPFPASAVDEEQSYIPEKMKPAAVHSLNLRSMVESRV